MWAAPMQSDASLVPSQLPDLDALTPEALLEPDGSSWFVVASDIPARSLKISRLRLGHLASVGVVRAPRCRF